MINPGTLAIPVLPSKILPQRVAESVQQIRFAANGVRLPTQSLDQIDERVFLLFHAVEEHQNRTPRDRRPPARSPDCGHSRAWRHT